MSNQPSHYPEHQGQGYQRPADRQQGSGWPSYQEPGGYAEDSAYGQPPHYGEPTRYGHPAGPKTLSIASMVCGIASVIMGWLMIPQLAAIITGHLALRREPSGKGLSIAGLVLGYLCLLGWGALWLLLIVGLVLAASGGTSGTF
ncbi:MAG: DUF4190 domain-containing protein [Pseudarthrobacter sp.]|nr:DUF4190 domain-containing protein [Pseudarthrobacter sp.]NUS35202.1 DUF4190 domain-containing protein [Pseudarthrobacter sp.]